MSCPVARLEMAIEGRIQFVRDILKAAFGEGEKEDDILDRPGSPELAAQQIMDWARRQQAQRNRQGKK